MAQVKLLKIASDGVPVEFGTTDDITLNSYTVTGGAQSLSATGLVLGTQDITGLKNISFNDPTTNNINQTAGALIVDNIMAKERNNVMTTAGAVLFPTVTDTGGQLDSFKIPSIAGPPTATPTFSSIGGYQVFDITNKKFYIWDGTAWDDQSTVSSANSIDDTYTAEAALAIRDAVYISAADNVNKALADSSASSRLLGFATAAALITAPVNVRKSGILTGFTGLTAAARYYLSPTVAGTISATVPSGSGQTIVQAGYAKSTTALDIQILQLGRRA